MNHDNIPNYLTRSLCKSILKVIETLNEPRFLECGGVGKVVRYLSSKTRDGGKNELKLGWYRTSFLECALKVSSP